MSQTTTYLLTHPETMRKLLEILAALQNVRKELARAQGG